MEANIQAQLQARIEAGATQNELLAAVQEENMLPTTIAPTNKYQSIVQAAISKNKGKKSTAKATVAEPKASQEKVREMAQKLGITFSPDLVALGTNSAISDALIEKAVSAGKSEAQINAAMASL